MVALARRRRLVSSSRARLSRALLVVVGRLQLAAIPLLLLGDLSRHRRRPGLVDDCLERDLLVMRCGGRWVGSAGYADVVLAPSLLFAPGALVVALAAGLGRVCTRTGDSDASPLAHGCVIAGVVAAAAAAAAGCVRWARARPLRRLTGASSARASTLEHRVSILQCI